MTPTDTTKTAEAPFAGVDVTPPAAPSRADAPAEAPSLEDVMARVEALESENAKLRQGGQASRPPGMAGVHVPQGQDTHRKNPTTDIVQTTRAGNVRVTHDPSPEFVLESGIIGNTDVKETPAS